MDEKIAYWIKRNRLNFLGILVGALGGFLYWNFIGCNSGACPITGNPYISTAYGALLGLLIFSSFKQK